MLRSRLFALAIVIAPATSPGHNDVSETIKALSLKIEKQPTAELYYQRATEFRALQEKTHAIEDFESALKLAPENRRALVALVQLYGADKKAETLISRYRVFAKTKEEKFEAHYLLASYFSKLGRHEVARSHCDTLQVIRPNDDPALDLFHSGLLLKLQRPQDAAAVLKKSAKRTKSIVVRNNWIDAALAAGQTGEILPLIENELSSSRFRSSWLIRRARAHLIHARKDEAKSDLDAALAEIAPRINRDRPDLTLVADRGLIYALLGKDDLAKKDLQLLKNSGFPPEAYRLLKHALQQK